MVNFQALEPAIDPNNRITFLLDWELTMKCNLDCSYCGTDLYRGGHNNSMPHPNLADCLKSVDFMFEYVDLYMASKPQGIKYAVLNVYGGESLYHPDIVEILNYIRERYQQYSDRWHLTVTTTTNAIVSNKRLAEIIPFIDEFTVSYHSENSEKQKQQFKQNLLTIASHGKRQKCIVMMHDNSDFFEDAQRMIVWLEQNNIRYLPKQLDADDGALLTKRIYSSEKVQWFNTLYKSKSWKQSETVLDQTSNTHLTDVGRACCGGRQLCSNQNHSQRQVYVANKFPDWYCSVNHFFVFIKQVTGEIFVNKDCKMNFDGTVGAIGTIEHSNKLIETVKHQLATGTMPVIQCKKKNCLCGLCAPKAKDLETYQQIMKKYQKVKQ